MNKVYLPILALVSLLVGFLGGYSSAAPKTNEIISRLESSGFLPMETGKSTEVSGSIKSIGVDEINVIISPLSVRNIVLGKEDIRSIKVTDATEIVRLTEKSEEEFRQEFNEFQEAAGPVNTRPGAEPVNLPSTFEEIIVPFSELKIGDNVTVIFNLTTDGDISDVAGRIILNG